MGLVETCLRPPVGGSWWMVDGLRGTMKDRSILKLIRKPCLVSVILN